MKRAARRVGELNRQPQQILRLAAPPSHLIELGELDHHTNNAAVAGTCENALRHLVDLALDDGTRCPSSRMATAPGRRGTNVADGTSVVSLTSRPTCGFHNSTVAYQ